ncbi:MAG: DNA repair protein RadA, partial [Christensenellaceae bacterium]|nr:DNA repair protein RadA [Christensenellaceae bacterium]
MPAKITRVYRCSECGYESSRWQGKCPDCGSWNTMEEAVIAQTPKTSAAKAAPSVIYSGAAKPLKDISAKSSPRVYTGISE